MNLGLIFNLKDVFYTVQNASSTTTTTSFEEISTPGQTQTEREPRVYPLTTAGCCTAWIRCWQ